MDRRILKLACLAACLAAVSAKGATAGASADAGPTGLGGAAAADSLRTNVWLVEALMGEIVVETAASLPPAPARVKVTTRAAGSDKADGLMMIVAARVLAERGYEVFAADADSTRGSAPDFAVTFSVHEVELSYPDVGRSLGLWRQWVERDVAVAVSVQLVDVPTGRLLLSDRLSRRFSDRVTDDEFPYVESRLYPFATAQVGESGWTRHLEEIAVLGTLAGLVAVYFANTGD